MTNIDNSFTVDPGLSIQDVVLVSTVTTDPRAGGGYEAPIGSLVLDSVSGDLYRKMDTGDTDWVRFDEGFGNVDGGRADTNYAQITGINGGDANGD